MMSLLLLDAAENEIWNAWKVSKWSQLMVHYLCTSAAAKFTATAAPQG